MKTCCSGRERKTCCSGRERKTLERDREITMLREELEDLREQMKRLKQKMNRREESTRKIIQRNREDIHKMLVKLEASRLNYSMEKRRVDMLENQNTHLKDRLRLQKQTNEILTMKQKEERDERDVHIQEDDVPKSNHEDFPTVTEEKEENNIEAVDKPQMDIPQKKRRTTDRVKEMIDAYPDDLKDILTNVGSEFSGQSDIE